MATLTMTGPLTYTLQLTQAEQDAVDKWVARPRAITEPPVANAAVLLQLRIQAALNETLARVDEAASDDLRRLIRNATPEQRTAAIQALGG